MLAFGLIERGVCCLCGPAELGLFHGQLGAEVFAVTHQRFELLFEVASVIFERKLQVEAIRTQLPDRRLFEIASPVVVALTAHDEEIPANVVMPQPVFCQRMDSIWTRGE